MPAGGLTHAGYYKGAADGVVTISGFSSPAAARFFSLTAASISLLISPPSSNINPLR